MGMMNRLKALELLLYRKLLRIPWTARISTPKNSRGARTIADNKIQTQLTTKGKHGCETSEIGQIRTLNRSLGSHRIHMHLPKWRATFIEDGTRRWFWLVHIIFWIVSNCSDFTNNWQTRIILKKLHFTKLPVGMSVIALETLNLICICKNTKKQNRAPIGSTDEGRLLNITISFSWLWVFEKNI